MENLAWRILRSAFKSSKIKCSTSTRTVAILARHFGSQVLFPSYWVKINSIWSCPPERCQILKAKHLPFPSDLPHSSRGCACLVFWSDWTVTERRCLSESFILERNVKVRHSDLETFSFHLFPIRKWIADASSGPRLGGCWLIMRTSAGGLSALS